MNIKELYGLLLGTNKDYSIVFKIEGRETIIKFNMIELCYKTKTLVFRQAQGSHIELDKGMRVSEVLSLISNLNHSWTVEFEDIEEPAETYTISSAEISLLHKQVVLKYWN